MEWKQNAVQGIELIYFCAGSWFDIKDQKIPVWFLRFFVILAIGCNVFGKYQNFREVLAGSILGGIFWVIGWLSKEAIGYGDGIALMTLGIFEGGMQMIPIVFWAFLACGFYGGWKMIRLKIRKDCRIPFYPFLLIAFLGVKFL